MFRIESTYICHISESNSSKGGYISLSASYVTVTLRGTLRKVMVSLNARSNSMK